VDDSEQSVPVLRPKARDLLWGKVVDALALIEVQLPLDLVGEAMMRSPSGRLVEHRAEVYAAGLSVDGVRLLDRQTGSKPDLRLGVSHGRPASARTMGRSGDSISVVLHGTIGPDPVERSESGRL
jgi:hypothetical protein